MLVLTSALVVVLAGAGGTNSSSMVIQVALSEDLNFLVFEHDQTLFLRTHISFDLHLQKISWH